MGKNPRNKKKPSKTYKMCYDGEGPSLTINRPKTQKELTREEMEEDLYKRIMLLNERRPIIKSLRYSNKHKMLLYGVLLDKLELDREFELEDEMVGKELIRGYKAIKEKGDPRVFIDCGRLLNVLYQVGVTTILANFMLLDVPVDRDVTMIAGRSFLYICGAIMNTIKGKMSTFDGFVHQQFNVAKVRNVHAESDSDDDEDYCLKRDDSGKPFYGPNYAKKRVVTGNNYTRVTYNNSTRKTHPSAHKKMAPRAVLMKTGLRPLNIARPVNTAHPKTTVNSARPNVMLRAVNTARPRAVNTARPRVVNTARPNSAVVNAVRASQVNAVKTSACWVWRPTKTNGASITLKRHNYIDERNDQDMFDTSILDNEEVVAEKEVSTADSVPTAGEVVTTAGVEVSTVAITSQISMDEITLAKALIDIKTSKPKAKGIMTDEEVARNLEAQMQAELEEEERLARQKEEEANIALVVKYDNTQAMMDADYELATRLQKEEIGELNIEERSRLRAVNTARPRAVNTARPRVVNTARPNSAVVNAVRASQEVSTADSVPTAGEVVTTAGVEVSTAAITSQISMDEITLAKALIDIKTSKPKAKGIVIQEPSETPKPTPIDSSQQPSKAKDKGKAKIIEPEKPLKKKD
nr:hypothetical protein [Tanacetum cinerariifolium]